MNYAYEYLYGISFLVNEILHLNFFSSSNRRSPSVYTPQNGVLGPHPNSHLHDRSQAWRQQPTDLPAQHQHHAILLQILRYLPRPLSPQKVPDHPALEAKHLLPDRQGQPQLCPHKECSRTILRQEPALWLGQCQSSTRLRRRQERFVHKIHPQRLDDLQSG